jgi:hypothetical protein
LLVALHLDDGEPMPLTGDGLPRREGAVAADKARSNASARASSADARSLVEADRNASSRP